MTRAWDAAGGQQGNLRALVDLFRPGLSSLLVVYSGYDSDRQRDDRVEVRLIDFAQSVTPLSEDSAKNRYACGLWT